MLKHLAIIPDGNRRWAREKGLSSSEGHRFAAEKTLPKLIDFCLEKKIPYFTFWALSTENLKNRSQKEIDHLFSLFRFFLDKKKDELNKKNIKVKVIGNIADLPRDLQEKINHIQKMTENNKAMTIVFAINYGGRDEIIRAIKKIKNKKLKMENLDKDSFSLLLDTAGIPDPDLIIRTGGEKRLSGFMLWQSEYSELYFSKVFFPDFSPEEIQKAIDDYYQRQRRFGK